MVIDASPLRVTTSGKYYGNVAPRRTRGAGQTRAHYYRPGVVVSESGEHITTNSHPIKDSGIRKSLKHTAAPEPIAGKQSWSPQQIAEMLNYPSPAATADRVSLSPRGQEHFEEIHDVRQAAEKVTASTSLPRTSMRELAPPNPVSLDSRDAEANLGIFTESDTEAYSAYNDWQRYHQQDNIQDEPLSPATTYSEPDIDMPSLHDLSFRPFTWDLHNDGGDGEWDF
jgi:hypothetical protein